MSDSEISRTVGLAVGVPVAVVIILVLLALSVIHWKRRANRSKGTIEMQQRGTASDAYDDVTAVRQATTP
jgi:hypothetical protein